VLAAKSILSLLVSDECGTSLSFGAQRRF